VERGSAKWFNRTKAYPGYEPIRPANMGSFVRLFRDIGAYEQQDALLSLDVPLGWLDEVEAPQ
jgi:hypothetical protein